MASNSNRSLAGKTIFVTGASRGIGKAIALRAARDGANVVIAAKTAEPHPKLPGTIYTAAKEIEAAGGRCLPCLVDVRNEAQVLEAVQKAVDTFGGIDILVNNASAISLTPTEGTDMKRYDLMQSVNTRGTFLVSKACLPYLKKGKNPHILNLSPPLNMSPMWFQNHLAYTMSKYGMSMCALGMAEEYRSDGVAVNTLWPRTTIKTAATDNLAGSEASAYSRTPEIMADAAYAILTKDSRTFTGNFVVDEDFLRAEGMSQVEIDKYACDIANKENLMMDFFLDVNTPSSETTEEGSSDVEKVFSAIQSSLSKELVNKVQGVFEFELRGMENQTWFLDLKNGSGSCGRGRAPSTPDATLITDDVYFCKLFSGNLRITAALMAKKLEVHGDLKKALKLETLMGSIKSKL